MVPLELQRRIINRAIIDADLRVLVTLGIVYLVVILGQNALKLGLRMYQGWISESAIRYTRTHLSRIYECRRATLGADTSGRAVSVIGAEVEQLGGFVGEGFSEPVVHVATLLVILGYMATVEPLIMAAGLVLLVPQVLIAVGVQRMINPLVETRIDLLRRLGGRLASAVNPMGAIDGEAFDGIYRNRMRIYALKFVGKAATNLLNALAPLGALLVGGYLVIHGETTIGAVVAFISGFERLSDPLRQMTAFYRIAAQANVRHRKIAQLM
ncbi:MAG TPA: ABC transporter ATP-binding protein [Alphaproteobacteria bacterium]|nr:ABC transporter ATP-binding protein [Alphaproteobacteria bacterium]